MSFQSTLLTSHKGVDLHAATAWRVMCDRLAGGDRLAALHRCELHTFWGEPPGVTMARLLDTGRYFNPNKHHFGHFILNEATTWNGQNDDLPTAWPGEVRGTDLDACADDAVALYRTLLGGEVPDGHVAVDVATWVRDQDGPVVSGVLWRLIIAGNGAEARAVGESLAVARGRKSGLLLNPHMECRLTAVR